MTTKVAGQMTRGVTRFVESVSELSNMTLPVDSIVQIKDRESASFLVKSGTADGFSTVATGTAGIVAEIIAVGLQDFRAFGAINDGSFDNTPVIESAESVGARLILIDRPAGSGQFFFGSVPSITNIQTIHSNSGNVSGVTLSDLNGVATALGTWGGYAHSKELAGKQVEIVAGTLRQQVAQAIGSDPNRDIAASGTTANVLFPDHGYDTGDRVLVQDADQAEYNGVWVITVIDTDNFQYTMNGTPAASPATGSVSVRNLSKWYWINDANHEPIGVNDSVPAQASGFQLTIPFEKAYSRVLSVVCGPDESLASGLSLSVGASVGLSDLTLEASANITTAYSIEYTGSGNFARVRGFGQGGVGEDFQIGITDISHNDSTGVTTIQHGCMPGFDVSVTPWTGGGTIGSAVPYLPVVASTQGSYLADNLQYETELQWIDLSTGNFVLAGNAPMACLFSKSYDGAIYLDGQGGTQDLELNKGNIWFFGIMEV